MRLENSKYRRRGLGHVAAILACSSLGAVAVAHEKVPEESRLLIRSDELVKIFIDTRTTRDSDASDKRALVIGDFVRFNELFADAVLKLPDASVSSGQLDLTIRNLICTDINVGDIVLDYSIIEDNIPTQSLALTVTATPFAMNCFADYDYQFVFLSGTGTFEAVTSDNTVNTRIDLNSPNGFRTEPPETADVEYCSATINAVDVTFQGGTVAAVLNLFEDLVNGVIEQQAQQGASMLSSRRACVCVFVFVSIFIRNSCIS